MPLNIAALQSGLESAFASPPATVAECAQAWADAVQSWASGILPASTTVSAAAAALSGALASAFSSPAAIPGLEAAFATFAGSVGLGMAGYVPVPPPSPVGFAAQFGGPHPPTHAAAAQAIAGLLDAWMRTGTGTLVAPPNTVIPWS